MMHLSNLHDQPSLTSKALWFSGTDFIINSQQHNYVQRTGALLLEAMHQFLEIDFFLKKKNPNTLQNVFSLTYSDTLC